MLDIERASAGMCFGLAELMEGIGKSGFVPSRLSVSVDFEKSEEASLVSDALTLALGLHITGILAKVNRPGWTVEIHTRQNTVQASVRTK